MATIKAFRAVRPAKELVDKIAALPYDVYNRSEAREVVAHNMDSFLSIDRAETLLEPNIDLHSPLVYEKARDTMYEWLQSGRFIQDETDSFYLYELTMSGRSQIGLVAATSVDEYLDETIKKHEKTRADKELDRINHVDYCNANTGPIFLTYRHRSEIDKLVSTWCKNHEPMYDYLADDGVGHKAWLVDEASIIEAFTSAYQDVPALYIADGHHRAASAVKVAKMRREQNPDYTGNESFNYFLSVIFPDNQLAIMDYNRVVKDLAGLSSEAFIEALSVQFTLSQPSLEAIRPQNKCEFSMFFENQWYLLTAKEGTYPMDDPVASLDVAILQDNLLSPILKIGDPRTDQRIDFVGGIRGLNELERRVKDDMKVAFAMYPTSIEELMAIADAGELMPPKSTWFEPKLRSGMFIHLLK